MKKLLLFAAVAGFGLVSASPPDKGPDNEGREARRHYPPCSRTVTDRCIQLHERGVRARHHREDHADAGNRAHDHHRGRPDHHADAGDRAHHGARREHHAHRDGGRHDHAAADHRPAHRMAMATRTVQRVRATGCRCHQPRRHYAQRVRRAGERG